MCFEMYTIKTDKGQRFTEEIVKLIRMSTTKIQTINIKAPIGRKHLFYKKKKTIYTFGHVKT